MIDKNFLRKQNITSSFYEQENRIDYRIYNIYLELGQERHCFVIRATSTSRSKDSLHILRKYILARGTNATPCAVFSTGLPTLHPFHTDSDRDGAVKPKYSICRKNHSSLKNKGSKNCINSYLVSHTVYELKMEKSFLSFTFQISGALSKCLWANVSLAAVCERVGSAERVQRTNASLYSNTRDETNRTFTRHAAKCEKPKVWQIGRKQHRRAPSRGKSHKSASFNKILWSRVQRRGASIWPKGLFHLDNSKMSNAP